MELRSTAKDRKEVIKNNLQVYAKHILNVLKQAKIQDVKQVESMNEVEFPEDVFREFECPVCLEIMEQPKRIYACSNDHYICSLCLTDPQITLCPSCREDFQLQKPKLRLTSERILAKIIHKG